MRNVLAALVGVTLTIGLGGCVSLLPKAAPAQLYRFGAGDGVSITSAGAPKGTGASKVGVVLTQIGFPRASTSDGILTVTGDQTAYLGGVRWVSPARALFLEAAQRMFGARAQQVELLDAGDVGAAGAVLRIDVTAFEARYSHAGAAPVVNVALSARLTRSDGQVLDQRSFSAVKPASDDAVSAIVKTFDGATDEILAQVIDWTDAQMSSPQALVPKPASAPAASTLSTTSTSSTVTTTSQPH